MTPPPTPEAPAPGRPTPGWRRPLFRAGLALLALLLTLSAVLVIRALRHSSRQLRVAPVPLLALAEAPLLDRLGAALRLPTVSHPDPAKVDREPFRALRATLARSFPRVHRHLAPEVVGTDSLLFTWPGRDPALRPLLLLAHLDVVPADPATRARWQHPPFAGAHADGYVWGRGAMDDKSRAVAILEALEHLLGQGFAPRRTVLVAFGQDEEVGGQRGARLLAARLKARGARSFMTLDEGLVITKGIIPGVNAPVAVVGIAEKGYVTLELLAEAPGGHSSMPPNSTAVGRLAAAIQQLETNPMTAHLEGPIRRTLEAVGPEMPFSKRLVFANLWLFGSVVRKRLEAKPATNAVVRTTFAPTMLEGSRRENVLAQRARALVNVRIHPRDSIATVLSHARAVIQAPGVRVRALPEGASPPVPASPTDGAAWRVLARTIRQVFPDALVAPGLMVGLTDSRHYRGQSGAIYRFAPLRITDADRARFHGVNERLSVRNYREMITFFVQLIQNADGAG